jgi:Holliday junction DNA helicase RuvA
MIRYLQGKVIRAGGGRIVVLTAGVGYEVLLPDIVWQAFLQREDGGDAIELHIAYHQTAQQPKPTLIGFTSEVELEFFEQLITVKDIGPVMASRALVMPVPHIARAIEDRDLTTLTRLKGIGRRKAEMIISELHGKVGKFALMRQEIPQDVHEPVDFSRQVVEVLVRQLGHNRTEAIKMVAEALQRMPDAATPEALFEEVYRGTRTRQ